MDWLTLIIGLMDWLTLIIGLIIGFFVGRYYQAILKANRVIKEENSVW